MNAVSSEQENCQKSLQQLWQNKILLSEAANRLNQSSSNELQSNFRFYINFYIQHRKLSEQFFICLCEHSVLQKLFITSAKQLPSIVILELFHLLISNINTPNDLVYIFSQPLVHEYLFEKFNLYKENGETIQYYVQLLKTIIMKMDNQGNQFLIKMFCNKRFPTFPLLTAATLLGVSQTCDELVRITAQQCVLILINLINRHKTGLVYLNELQLIVYFYELTRSMLDEQTNTDYQGSIKYFIDLVFTLRNNQTSIYLLFNLLVNHLFFKNIKAPWKILRFIGELRKYLTQYPQFQNEFTEDLIKTLFRIFSKFYLSKFINYTYFSAQQIIPQIIIKPQPKLLKFYSQRCRKIDDYLINEQDYYNSEQGNEYLIDQWIEFNNNSISSAKVKKIKGSLSQFFSTSDSTADKYIQDVMLMAGLQVQKLKSPIIKLTFSSNFKTSVFLCEAIMNKVGQNNKKQKKIIHNQFCKDENWVLQPSQQLFIEIYQIYLKIKNNESSFIVNDFLMQGQSDFIEQIRPTLTKLITYQLCQKAPNVSRNYILILFKLVHKLRLDTYLLPSLIEKLLQKLLYLQKIIGQFVFYDEKIPSFLNYVSKNKERSYWKEKIDIQGIKKGKISLEKRKETKFQHYLFYYQVIKNFLDPSLKMLNQFVEEYWKINFGSKQAQKKQFKALMIYKDVQNHIIEVYASDRFQFEVSYKTKTQQIAQFKIKDKDFFEDKQISTILLFQQYKNPIKLQSIKQFQNFKKDIYALRQKRKQILRVALLEYMPFIYQSIQVKYRNHRYQINYKPSK